MSSRRSHDTRSQAVKSLPARSHLTGRCVREDPRHTLTGGQIPASETALGRSPCEGVAAKHVHNLSIPTGHTALGRLPCHGGTATHVHRRSNPCLPDRTRQVAVSGRSRDTRSQAVKSLPARPHSAGCRVREEPRHTFTGGQIPACQTALSRSPCQGGAATHVHRQLNPFHPKRTRHSPCQLGGTVTHVHMQSNACRQDHTRQVPVSARRSRDTRSQGCQTIPARSHLAGRRVREDPRHTLTGGQIPASETALGRSPCQGVAATHVHRRSNPTGHTALGRLPCQ